MTTETEGLRVTCQYAGIIHAIVNADNSGASDEHNSFYSWGWLLKHVKNPSQQTGSEEAGENSDP